ncbi:hypothetical protein ACFVNB_33270 [Streptomyces rochei]|uniref:hypothetical protein n=1 Tax=Streptomyces rochei TaxID=1928 RepID=UPI00368B7440
MSTLTSRSLGSDRLMDEVHAAGGDAKRLGVLSGLSVSAACRYTFTLRHPACPLRPVRSCDGGRYREVGVQAVVMRHLLRVGRRWLVVLPLTLSATHRA